jgi:uncharacterized membrane protein
MTLRWTLIFRMLSGKLSVRAGLFCVGAIITALLAVFFSPYVPEDVAKLLGGDAVDRILTILASSMLAVVTFSLSTLIASYSVAGASAPARATSLIMRDTSAQTALSTFLGAFIFSIVSLVALSTGYYGSKGRVILFGMTIIVLSAVILTVIKWIGQLSEMGQLGSVIAKIEHTSIDSIKSQAHLFIGDDDGCIAPKDVSLIECEVTGFIQTIDLQGLSDLVENIPGEIWIEVHAGQYVYPGLPLAKITGEKKDLKETHESIRKNFFVGHRRTFEDDPRFGLIVLSEIASRALSPGINDPGSAIEIIGSLLRLISRIQNVVCAEQERWWSKELHLKSITPDEVLDDAFQAISRDGAAIVEVGIFLQKSLGVIYRFPKFSTSAYKRSIQSLEMAARALKNKEDMERLSRASAWNREVDL